MCENVKYDYDSLNSMHMSGDKFSLNGREMRIVSGVAADTNGTVTPFIKKACVCQEYTKAMQFLCKMVDIPVFDALCAINTPHEKTPHILFNEPDEIKASNEDHSIQKVNLDGNIYYSDLTWDACYYQAGLTNNKYFLLSHDDISKDHPFVNEKAPAIINKSASIDKRNELLSFARVRISSVNLEKESNQESKGISK
jgi:transglutaminase/protease-like cytokinesis protein 3